MSWQAVEAVQDHSKLEDHTALCIMYAIARAADADGVVGANGKVTSPSIDSLAAKSRCHRNTILNWLPKLEASGELLIERFGVGRGAWNRYTILLPIGTSIDVPIGQDNGTSNLEIMVQSLVVMVQELKVMVQETVQNGTSHIVLDTKDTEEKKEDKSDNHHGEPIEELVDYFLTVSGCKKPGKNTDYVGEWLEPLIEIYQHAGNDFNRTKQAIAEGVMSMRSAPKRYTIASPGSIQNAAVAWLGVGRVGQNGRITVGGR